MLQYYLKTTKSQKIYAKTYTILITVKSYFTKIVNNYPLGYSGFLIL